jgi:hypothetical protein
MSQYLQRFPSDQIDCFAEWPHKGVPAAAERSQQQQHSHNPSRVVSAGWDGLIKMFE